MMVTSRQNQCTGCEKIEHTHAQAAAWFVHSTSRPARTAATTAPEPKTGRTAGGREGPSAPDTERWRAPPWRGGQRCTRYGCPEDGQSSDCRRQHTRGLGLGQQRFKASREELFDALRGGLTPSHRSVLNEPMHHIEEINARIARFDGQLLAGMAERRNALALLQTDPDRPDPRNHAARGNRHLCRCLRPARSPCFVSPRSSGQ